MSLERNNITVYYDGACPSCVKDRKNYEVLASKNGRDVIWIDITGKDDELREIGIDPHKALRELHIKDENQNIISEIDAYIILMRKVLVLKPLAWFIGLPVIRPLLSKIYHWQVNRRLRRDGRL
jgi:predicted DCC family thiol-disulfide oxidoreductase YuxK